MDCDIAMLHTGKVLRENWLSRTREVTRDICQYEKSRHLRAPEMRDKCYLLTNRAPVDHYRTQRLLGHVEYSPTRAKVTGGARGLRSRVGAMKSGT